MAICLYTLYLCPSLLAFPLFNDDQFRALQMHDILSWVNSGVGLEVRGGGGSTSDLLFKGLLSSLRTWFRGGLSFFKKSFTTDMDLPC